MNLPERTALRFSGHCAVRSTIRMPSASRLFFQSSSRERESWSDWVANSITSGLPSGSSRQPSPSRST